jgi:hypothetical protein
MSNWLGYDSNEPYILKHHVPHPQFVWRYGNGIYAWPDAGLFPGVRNATIDVIGDDWRNCDELQVDGFDQAQIDHMIELSRGWVEERHKTGPATVYVNRANLPAVTRKLDGLDWWLHLATLDGTTPIVPLLGTGRLAAIQTWGEAHLGFHADASVIVSAEWYEMHRG